VATIVGGVMRYDTRQTVAPPKRKARK